MIVAMCCYALLKSCSFLKLLPRIVLTRACTHIPVSTNALPMVFKGRTDLYGGITIRTHDLEASRKESQSFDEEIQLSVDSFRDEGIRGIWIKVDIKDSHLIPILVKHKFVFHHAQVDYVMMTRWLPHLPNTLPRYPHTTIGVGGLVVDENDRVLLMKERKGMYLGWKFPGGLSDPGENIYETASREVFEETGVESEGQAVLCFRQISASKWRGVSDIYFICIMKLRNPENKEIKACPHETADCRWFTRDEIREFPPDEFHDFHHQIIQQYDTWKASGRKGCHKISGFAPIRGLDVHMFYIE